MAGRARRLSVHTTDLNRLGKWALARGRTTLAADALPGGAYRLHFVAPAGVSAPDAEALVKEKAEWDED